MDHDKTGCQAPPERPILCVNNCGFFGSSATMNMCSKCHKDLLMKEEQAKTHIMKGSSSSSTEPLVVDVQVSIAEPNDIPVQPGLEERVEAKPKAGPNRCNSCKKRVGLMGFKCRCGHLYCSSHRYSDKHECRFDYRNAAQEAIAKANPVVRAEKLDKI